MEDKQLIQETALSIRDQFDLEAIPGSLISNEQKYAALKKLLVKRIEEMIDFEFDKFINLLYRIDVNESKVKQALAEKPFSKGIEKVADMIIQRQLQKIKTRNKYSSSNHDLDFDI